MAELEVGDKVRVSLPRGKNKRGVPGIHMMFSSWPQARFDGAVGVVEAINPRGPYEIPLYLVNFRGQNNRIAIPWMADWFREAWLELVERAAVTAETPAPETAAAVGTTAGATAPA